jgi:hypothetical protein
MAAQDGECTQTMRVLLSRGTAGIAERTRGLVQRWFDMVDWRSANVGSVQLGDSRGIESHTKKLEGEVNRQHPARVWVERQERESAAKKPEWTTTTHECTSQLSQLVTGLQQDATEAAKGCSELEGTPTEQLRAVVNFLQEMEIRCAW